MTTIKKNFYWKVNTGGLLKEIMNNPGAGILIRPMQMFAALLTKVGERAAQLNDPELNKLMCLLAIYEIADPYSPNYDPEAVKKVMEEAESK